MFKKIFLIIITVLLVKITVSAQEQEYLLKAAFLEKFCRFTEWEKGTIDRSDYFYIAVYQTENISEVLRSVFTDLQIKGKAVKVIAVDELSQLEVNPHLIFIPKNKPSKIDKIIKYSQENNVLLVGDDENYGKLGVHISFYITDEGTLHFIINLESIKESHLRLNLMLIEIAKII